MKQGEGYVEADTAHLFAGVFSAVLRIVRSKSEHYSLAVLVIRCQTSTDPMLRNRGWPRMSLIVFCRSACRARCSVSITPMPKSEMPRVVSVIQTVRQ